VTGELATRMRVQKELNFVVNGFSSDRVQNALTGVLRRHDPDSGEYAAVTISSSQRLPKLDHSVPIVLSGGTAIPKGFLSRFTTALQTEDFL